VQQPGVTPAQQAGQQPQQPIQQGGAMVPATSVSAGGPLPAAAPSVPVTSLPPTPGVQVNPLPAPAIAPLPAQAGGQAGQFGTAAGAR
jgi:general secretion pathway protein D